jgi:hypothetical protein
MAEVSATDKAVARMNSDVFRFILDTINSDRRAFKHPDNDPCPHVEEVLNASLAGLQQKLGLVPPPVPPVPAREGEGDENQPPIDPAISTALTPNLRRRPAFSGSV